MLYNPLYLVKTYQQVDEKKNDLFINIFKRIYDKQGIFGLYRGLVVSWNRDIFPSGIYFFIYNYLKDKNNKEVLLFFYGGISGIIFII